MGQKFSILKKKYLIMSNKSNHIILLDFHEFLLEVVKKSMITSRKFKIGVGKVICALKKKYAIL